MEPPLNPGRFKAQFADLEHLRKIRNEFAHSWQPISFVNPKVAGHIKAMHYSRINDEFPESPQEKVRTSISGLLIELSSAAHQLDVNGGRVGVSGRHLIAGFPGVDFDKKFDEARRHLAGIGEALKSADGEKAIFFRMVLARFGERVNYVESDAPIERRTDVLALREELNRLKAEYQ